MLVAALIGLAADFILEEVLNLEIQAQADLFSTGSDLMAWVVAGALFALRAAIVLYLLVMSTPAPPVVLRLGGRPRHGDPRRPARSPATSRLVPAILAAIVWIVIGSRGLLAPDGHPEPHGGPTRAPDPFVSA